MTLCLRRRDFIAGLGGAVAWPVAAGAQQRALPVIGYLSGRSLNLETPILAAFRQGLKETGYNEGQNVAIEYRFADGQGERLALLALDLALRQVAVIVFAGIVGDQPLRSMRDSSIPILFVTGSDPVQRGIVASLSHPGGNLTGLNTLVAEAISKHIGLLHELVPNIRKIAVLSTPSTRASAQLRAASAAASALGLEVLVLEAGSEGKLDTAFTRLGQDQAGALFVLIDPFLTTHARQIVALAARDRVPALYARRQFIEAGGLVSYDYDIRDGYRWIGTYAGRILKGERPADLPVIQPTKFELVINLKAAKAINFEIPPLVRALADEIIE